MGITTRLVQTVLYIEMFVFTLLILPIPKSIKKAAIKTFYSFKILFHFFYVLYVMILIMFIDSLVKLNQVLPYELIYHTERNFYLTGFTLYLSLIFKIFINMLYSLYREEKSVEILKKQIKNSQSFVDSIVHKNTDKEEEISKLHDKVEEYKKEINSKKVILKQCSNNQKEYFNLLDKYNELLEKLKRETKKSK